VSIHPDIAAVLSGESEGCIVCGDCLEIMADMPDGCVDAVVTDAPYGVGIDYASFDDTRENVKALAIASVPTWIRVASCALVTCGNGSQRLWPEPSWTLAWCIPAGAGCNRWGFTCWQPILAYGPCPYHARQKGHRPDMVTMTATSATVGHTCPKPLPLMEWIINRASCYPGDIILDPFCGSGTTCVAAKKLGRRWIGIEIDERYCAIARNRVRDTPRPLFAETSPTKQELGLFDG